LLIFRRGASPSQGSEHTINGLHSADETHFVFSNLIIKQLAVLVFFIVISPGQQQSAWRSYDNNAVTLFREGTQVQFMANLIQLMGAKNSFRDFWRCNDSLTTPPCSEGVICKYRILITFLWIALFCLSPFKGTVFNSPIHFSYDELQALSLNVLHRNFRPTQLRHNRIVYQSKLAGAASRFRCYSLRWPLMLVVFLSRMKSTF
jgi:carbonic anhydrase